MNGKRLLGSLFEFLAVIPFLSLAAFAAGLAVAPGVYLYESISPHIAQLSGPLYFALTGILLVSCYAAYGLSLIIVAPTLNLLLGGRLKPFRSSAVSFKALPWYIHCCMTLIVRLSFLEFVTPTPLNILFYRLMGMKIGYGVQINSTAIADPSLIELGERVIIGGSASIMAHYAQGGYLVVAPVKIGRGATIGLRAIVMGGVEIGEKAKVLAGSFVLPGTKIPAGETWGGIPAQPVDIKKFREKFQEGAEC